MRRRICLPFRTYGSTPAWVLTWSPSPEARACAGRRTQACCWAGKHLTDLAQQNNNPEDGVGRGMKVAKEQIVGMVAAVDWVLSHTEESMQGDYQKRVDLIVSAVKGIPSVTTETVVPKIANHVPHLLIRFDPSVTGITTDGDRARLREGKPSIELNPNTGHPPNQGIPSNANTLVVGVWMLQPGEDAVVGRRIREAFSSKA